MPKQTSRRVHGRRRPARRAARANRMAGRKPKPVRGPLRTALALIGPRPVTVAQKLWRRGIEALEALCPEAYRRWHPGIVAAAIVTLTEDRPGIVKFWEGFRDGIAGWPMALAAISEQLAAYPEGRTPKRQAELALYAAHHYCRRTSLKRLENKYLRELAEPLERHRIRGLQAVFLGSGDGRQRSKSDEWSPAPARKRRASLKIELPNKKPILLSFERDFFDDVVRVIGLHGFRSIATEIAAVYDPETSKHPLSSIVHDQLVELIAANLPAARIMGLQNEALFVNPKFRTAPRVKKPRSQDKRSPDDVPYQRNTSVIINCDYRRGKKGTSVSMSRPLYELAKARFGKAEVNQVLRHVVEHWDSSKTPLTRSQAAQEAVLLMLCKAL